MQGEALRFEMCSSLVLAWTFTYPYFDFPSVPCPMRVQPSQAPRCRRVLSCPAASSTPAGPRHRRVPGPAPAAARRATGALSRLPAAGAAAWSRPCAIPAAGGGRELHEILGSACRMMSVPGRCAQRLCPKARFSRIPNL